MNLKNRRFPGIQIARLFAALLVVIYHLSHYADIRVSGLKSIEPFIGQVALLGVFIFFSISGFVITEALQRTNSWMFLLHRVYRIYPTYWLAIIITIIIKLICFGQYPLPDHFISSILLVPVGEITYPLGVEWSLIYEVFFYALISIIWLKKSNKVLVVAMLLWISIILLSATLSLSPGTVLLPTGLSIFVSFFDVPFILGVLIYFIRQKYILRHIGLGWIYSFALVLLGSLSVATEYRFLMYGFASSLIVYMVTLDCSINMPFIALLSKYGDYSFGLYLAHVPVMTIFLSIQNQVTVNDPVLVSLAALLISVAVGLSFGMLEFNIHKKSKKKLDIYMMKVV